MIFTNFGQNQVSKSISEDTNRIHFIREQGHITSAIDFGSVCEKSNNPAENSILKVNWVIEIFYKGVRKIEMSATRRYTISEENVPTTDEELERIIDESFVFFSFALDDVRSLNDTVQVLEGLNSNSRAIYVHRIRVALNQL